MQSGAKSEAQSTTGHENTSATSQTEGPKTEATGQTKGPETTALAPSKASEEKPGEKREEKQGEKAMEKLKALDSSRQLSLEQIDAEFDQYFDSEDKLDAALKAKAFATKKDEEAEATQAKAGQLAEVAEGDRKLADQLSTAIDEGNFDIRGPLGQRFRRAHQSGPEAEQLKAQKTQADKKAFRLAWAQATLTKISQKKVFQKSWKEVSEEVGGFSPTR